MAVFGVFILWLVYFSTIHFWLPWLPIGQDRILCTDEASHMLCVTVLSHPSLAHEAWVLAKMHPAQHLGLPFFREIWFIDCSCM